MPKRTDIESILLIGSGPIVIGQACEFDYSGTQALKALREEGYRVILVNSNPATIMTDPEFADRTYVEPLDAGVVTKIIEAERPDALLPTLGGQTALNLAIELAETGVLERHGVEMIGARLEAIKKAEDRDRFKEAMARIGLDLPRSVYVHSLDEALAARRALASLPLIIRPSRTLGGSGANIAYTEDEYVEMARSGLQISPVHEVLVEESVLGWKEFELEVMRDHKDNVVIVCPIENFDPMGVHTGDSITVAPAQTLTDKEYQVMRDAALRIIREIGVDTGGSNIQFAVNPDNGRLVVIEMNPRVSRSSALASKATGFPIAKIAAKLAVGYTLDEIPNDVTRETPASFEPTIDYVVVKVPRFTFEKFPQTRDVLTTQMKSVGEAMSMGRTFKEALQKAMRSLETNSYGFEQPEFLASLPQNGGLPGTAGATGADVEALLEERLHRPRSDRLWTLGAALRTGFTVPRLYELTGIDPWFLHHIQAIIEKEGEIRQRLGESEEADREFWAEVKNMGFSDKRLAELSDRPEDDIRTLRMNAGVLAGFRTVDTCGAEFEAFTPYYYSTYEGTQESRRSDRRKIMILGGGPNRIGQGIEFDYCCVQAAFALKEDGFETLMVNCNPETVSTDYDTSDKLYFEPLTLEDVLNIAAQERPDGVIVQFGGQTPLKLALALERAGVPIIGTSPDSIDLAEDRERFKDLLEELDLRQPLNGTARSTDEALRVAESIGYPVLVRPSYVLGGRAMEIVYEEAKLREYLVSAFQASVEHPVLIDKFLDDATEVDVDAIADGERVVIGGIMEHIERAGVHSGDSACSIPPRTLSANVQAEIRRQAAALATALKVRGLMNVQFAVKGEDVYILEVNPRASRTVPFVSKAIGVSLAKLAARVMAGRTLHELGFTEEIVPPHVSVKESVLPFNKFAGVDTLLGPEMKSTGEVMGIDQTFGKAFAKAQMAGGMRLPDSGTALFSLPDQHRQGAAGIARALAALGFHIAATGGTVDSFKTAGILVEAVPDLEDTLRRKAVAMVVNTHANESYRNDGYLVRRNALDRQIPYFTTLAGAEAAVEAIEFLKAGELTVQPLQEYQRHARNRM
ncbi:MAG: carbamoyl-phosphate synthase large subunit [Deltaproteobacteria bacterium]|nr:carbamoyl-phosphate synthase large subunit [Deltaproteobacteria bacterium]